MIFFNQPRYKMKETSLIFVMLSFGFTYGEMLSGFRVKYTASQPNVDGYFQMPRNTREAISLGFKSVPYQSDRGFNLIMGCSNGEVLGVCVLFDRAGYAAGMRIAIPSQDVESTDYDVGKFMKLENLNGQDYWTTFYYFESPESIKNGGRRGQVRQTIEGIWIENGNEILRIPLTETELIQKTLYKKQNCYGGMGTHYFHNIHPDLNCSTLIPYFILINDGKVIGVGLELYGKLEGQSTKWFETAPTFGRDIIPTHPACLRELINVHGLILFHTYFIEEPWKLTCEVNETKKQASKPPIKLSCTVI